MTGGVDIHAGEYRNPHASKGHVTVLCVHGLTEVGSMFEPLAKAIFADGSLKHVVKQVIAVDMPAHGASPAPVLKSPLTFSEWLIEDNVDILIQTLAYLRKIGKGPQIVLGHGMGGVVLQAAQETLLARRSSLADMGVYSAILMASVPARPTVWTRYPASDRSVYLVRDPNLGVMFKMPTAVCGHNGGFHTLAGSVVAAAPTSQVCMTNG